ncbi:hypothetical protein SAMN05446589_0352 [Streptomyces sp. OV198]|uniref:hypothetical protein n=1 Tax=Streptomyces sp. OV198 TaxID=1882787 RepID=UPI000BD56E2F|nr:hypothetical protein [Streptomyces sp. OV198]SOE51208.1 hypothetical protein SAMN05446589_0352 [Streptomyces sp. OV198]
MRRGIMAAVALAGLAAVGCDDHGVREDLVVTGTPPATPYAGRLDLPFRESADGSAREFEESWGAAGRALECDGPIYSGGGGDGWAERDGGSTPEEGLNAYFDMDQPELPDHGYRVERRAAGRVLFSYDVDGRTKIAVVVAKDQPNRPGWGPETNASCDPAELPASFTDNRFEIWTDRDGRRLPTTTVSSSTGPEHCDWKSVHFLALGGREDVRQYARDPRGVLGSELLTAAYKGDVRMPAVAHDTGYRFHDWALWLTDDKAMAYVRTNHGVEAWPATKERVACK